MSLASQVSDAVVRIGTEFKTVYGRIGTLANLTTTDKSSLVAAVNEVKASAGGASQPLDSDLTAIAAINANVAGMIASDGAGWIQKTYAQVKTALGLVKGDVGLGNVDNTSDVNKPVSTAQQTALNLKANLAGPALTGVPTAPTAVPGTSTTQIATTAFAGAAATAAQTAAQAYSDGLLDANNAMQYKGSIDASTNPNYPAANAGWTYKISVAGKIGGAAGPNVEVGDTLYCLTDGSAAGTQAAVGANWDIVQSNLDGAVVGPVAATAGDFATFSGATGKVVQDSGLSFDTDATMAANSDSRIASQKAVKSYTYSQTQIGDPTTDLVGVFNAALV